MKTVNELLVEAASRGRWSRVLRVASMVTGLFGLTGLAAFGLFGSLAGVISSASILVFAVVFWVDANTFEIYRQTTEILADNRKWIDENYPVEEVTP